MYKTKQSILHRATETTSHGRFSFASKIFYINETEDFVIIYNYVNAEIFYLIITSNKSIK